MFWAGHPGWRTACLPRAIISHPAGVLQVCDPRQIDELIVGRVHWQNEVSGLCACPGERLHTSQNGKRDCRVNVDGAPTIFCFHASCIGVVTEANRRLRRELEASPWELTLPDGQVLRSGDVLQRDGAVLRRERMGLLSPTLSSGG